MNNTQQPLLVAHRGGSALAPENTLAAFVLGLTYQPDMVELDVHLSKDGQLIVMHDPLLERTTGRVGAIADYDSKTLQTFDATATFPVDHQFGFQKIPTLEEVIDLVETQTEGKTGYQIEIKLRSDGLRYEGIEEAVIAVLKAKEIIDRTIIISFDFPTLESIGQKESSIKLGALISKGYFTQIGTKGPKAIADEMKKLGVDYVAVNYNYLNPTLYKVLKEQDLGIGAWTVNEKAAMQRIAAMGVDFITSDYPDLLRATLVE
jgi:glycerophosphoryl diester phosphodiesterase